tara:strand:- start:335 stop:466 length:132 start_codon:yes stop_codon:yes gene_type:complete
VNKLGKAAKFSSISFSNLKELTKTKYSGNRNTIDKIIEIIAFL